MSEVKTGIGMWQVSTLESGRVRVSFWTQEVVLHQDLEPLDAIKFMAAILIHTTQSYVGQGYSWSEAREIVDKEWPIQMSEVIRRKREEAENNRA